LDLDEKAEIAHFESGKDQYGQHTTLIEEALAQREEESKMSLWKIFKLYYPGATYGLLLSVALVMEGYDTGLVSLSVFTYLAFTSASSATIDRRNSRLTFDRSTTSSARSHSSTSLEHSMQRVERS
jgi:hypothetical protein